MSVVHISAGSYERVLFGFELSEWESTEEVQELEPIFLTPAHQSCIRAVMSYGSLLVTASTDESMKYIPITSIHLTINTRNVYIRTHYL